MLTLTLVVLCQIGSPQGVRLLDDAPLLAQVAPPLVPEVPAPTSEAQVSAAQLQVDIDALRKSRPGIGGGIALVTSGGTATLLGGLYLAISSIASFGSMLNPFIVIGAIGLAIGLPLVAIGVWLLYNRVEQRNRIDAEVKVLKEQLQRAPKPPRAQPRPYDPRPPPSEILPPPQVRGPESSIYVASF